MLPGRLRFVCLVLALVAGCGAKSSLEVRQWDSEPAPTPHPEVCNGLDDDLDGLRCVGAVPWEAGAPCMSGDTIVDCGYPPDTGVDAARVDGGAMDGGVRDAGAMDAGDGGLCDHDLFVDEDFRDSMGRYVDINNCGSCGHACVVSRPHERTVGCGLVAETPVCVALTCDPGFVPSRSGECVPAYDRLCMTCTDDGDCGDFDQAHCRDLGGERRCVVDCSLTCPTGYVCTSGACTPPSGSCSCEVGQNFTLACALTDPMGHHCPGSAACTNGVLSMCAAPMELCDHVDNDCNGIVDDGYRDARGAYILNIHDCGDCGVDCTLSSIPGADLICGGDPFAPSCVLDCPDAHPPHVGSHVDANRNIADGCECVISNLSDDPGPVRTSGSMLDVNCDGADGIVVNSFYVAPDGDDTGVGSPTHPLRTLAVAFMRASMSLTDPTGPRPHVFVASGTYTESVELPDGVQVHGGYRRDFLALDPDGFRVEIRAPAGTTAPGGAAVVVRGAGTTTTGMEWLTVRGLDATMMSAAAFGLVMIDPGGALYLRDMQVLGGVAGSGQSGTVGAAGRAFMTMPVAGDPPRGAIETASHDCIDESANVVHGGAGGTNSCGGIDTSGGAGGSAHCPMFAAFQGQGGFGTATGVVAGGMGGTGGQDSEGPILASTGACPMPVCCGLADFTVPGNGFANPNPGRAGANGPNGTAGVACAEPLGHFDADRWVGMDGTGGTAGSPGAGGGGGGAGGGAQMDWMPECMFADGIGGGGGGGGAGGCGGAAGSGGTSGAPSVAILVRYVTMTAVSSVPTISGVTIAPNEGGRGGDGGSGGDGGAGANGAIGTAIPLAMRSTPTLAGPFEGGRGGAGGNGGAGGGGGGGCGGASVGIWITGVTSEPSGVATWRTANTFVHGVAGTAGRGGGGAAPGRDGAAGGAMDVVVR
jgi:hypothetical protein